MKRTLLSVVAIFALALGLHAQMWIEQYSGMANSRGLTDLFAVDANVVWGAAYDGAAPTNACNDFCKTTNGGTLWTAGSITGATGLSIANIVASDGLHSWACCYNPGSGTNHGGVYYTADGGTTWTKQATALFTNSASFPDCIHFWNSNTGWVMGDPINGDFEMYTTTNGGTTWTVVPGAQIPNPLSGEWGVVGYYSSVGNTIWFGTNKGRVYKSTDQGHNWTVSQVLTWTSIYIQPYFKSATVGFVMDKSAGATIGNLAKTTDGGTTWTAITPTGSHFSNDMAYVPGSPGTWVTTGADVTLPAAGITYSFDDCATFTSFTETIGNQYLATAWASSTAGWAGAFVNAGAGGMWKFNGNLAQPVADFSANNTTITIGQSVTYTNLSTGAATYQWTFPGGNPGSSTLQTPPPVSYATAGTYDVVLTATGTFGSNTMTKTNYITVSPPLSLTVTAPNGGESWQQGTHHNITWTSSGVTNVKIEYTIDGGLTFLPVIASWPASNGIYDWLVPNTPSTQCKVRVVDDTNPLVGDLSNNVFSITLLPTATVQVLTPNGGESWQEGTSHAITWTSSGVTNVKIEYSFDNGANWSIIVPTWAASSGSYSWMIPGTPSAQCKVRVSDASDATIFDISDNVFTITPAAPSSVQVTSPNGGQTWHSGINYYLTWLSMGLTMVNIEYTIDNGATWTSIASNVASDSANSYIWNVPATSSSLCRVRVINAGNPNVRDQSDNVFTIVGGELPVINVVSPNGGETWVTGHSYAVTWTSTNVDNVMVEVSTDTGATWTTIVYTTPGNTGSFPWIVPDTPSSFCILKVSDVSNPLLFDESNGTFEITPNTGIGSAGMPRVNIYPNPTSGRIMIESGTRIEALSVYNPMGATIITTNPEQKEIGIDLSAYPKGIYFVKLTLDSKVAIYKVVVM